MCLGVLHHQHSRVASPLPPVLNIKKRAGGISMKFILMILDRICKLFTVAN